MRLRCGRVSFLWNRHSKLKLDPELQLSHCCSVSQVSPYDICRIYKGLVRYQMYTKFSHRVIRFFFKLWLRISFFLNRPKSIIADSNPPPPEYRLLYHIQNVDILVVSLTPEHDVIASHNHVPNALPRFRSNL